MKKQNFVDIRLSLEIDNITMSQNNTWMHYLNIGLMINGLMFLLSGCGEEICDECPCPGEAEFIYDNRTPHRIEMTIGNIEPEGILLYRDDVYCNVTEDGYGLPYLFIWGTTVYFNGTHCVTYESTSAFNGEGPVGIDNYRREKIHGRLYRLTYIFTEEDYEKAELCRYTPVTRDR